MTKIAAEHLARGAFVYVRQSTTDQVRNNHESRRRQYPLEYAPQSPGAARLRTAPARSAAEPAAASPP